MNNESRMLELILLVDDDDTTNFVNKRLLEKMRIARDIKVLRNGQEALDYIRRSCRENPEPGFVCPDLLFLDIKMPVMDGFTFLEKYQEEGLDRSNHLIIMMLTSSASFYDLEKLKQFEKVKKHYSKALTERDVREILNAYFSGGKN